MKEPPDGSVRSLKRVLSTAQLWAIAVGMVISGEYFGWNYGWAAAGTLGFLVSTLLVTILYITFIFSYTELTTAIPKAGGPFTYAQRAFGQVGGFVAGFATLVDFLMAPPAIAYALGSYVHFLNPSVPVLPTALGCYVVFISINYFGIRNSANFSLWVTILSVIELLVFMAVVWPYFKVDNFVANNPQHISAEGVFAGIPYAIWFFVAIEGVAMVAEEVKDPRRTIPKGYILSIFTLVILAIGIMVITGGVGNWQNLQNIDYPLPQALSDTLGKNHGLTKLFASFGLFGLIASFHCNTISYSRQIFALSREGFLPRILAEVNAHKSPYMALFAGGLLGMIALFVFDTQKIVILSVLGAVVMYIISMASLFVLRRKEPNLERPFKSPFYPVFPAIALLLSLVAMLAIIYFNPMLSWLFFGGMAISTILFVSIGLKFVKTQSSVAR
jgi:ethanolamine permease